MNGDPARIGFAGIGETLDFCAERGVDRRQIGRLTEHRAETFGTFECLLRAVKSL
jgi:hypothetical protein